MRSLRRLCEKYTVDTSANENGGLYENISKTSFGIDDMTDWVFDNARKAGDHEVFNMRLKPILQAQAVPPPLIIMLFFMLVTE